MTDKYESLRLRNQLSFPIYLCGKEIARHYQPMLERLNLTYTQYIVMMYFWEEERSSVREISHALLLDPSTLTPILKKLEAKGYLTRARVPEDERSLLITLTNAGAALQDIALDIPGRMFGHMGLNDEEADTLYALINKALSNISTQSHDKHPAYQ